MKKWFFVVLFLLVSLRCMDGAPSYVGYVDVANCNGIVGWAADTTRPNISIVVSLYDGTTLLTSTVASATRPDVGVVLKDNGKHGFSFPVPQDGATHVLALRFESSAVILSASPRTLKCGVVPPVIPPVVLPDGLPVVRETPVGTLDGVNTMFSLSLLPNTAFPLLVFKNGLLLSQCSSPTNCNGDYSATGISLSFATAPRPGDVLTAVYWRVWEAQCVPK